MKIEATSKGIVITLPNKILKSAATEHPETPVKIKNMKLFREAVAESIDEEELQQVFDNAIEQVAVNSDDDTCKLVDDLD